MIKYLFIQYLLQDYWVILGGSGFIFLDITNMIATSLKCKPFDLEF